MGMIEFKITAPETAKDALREFQSASIVVSGVHGALLRAGLTAVNQQEMDMYRKVAADLVGAMARLGSVELYLINQARKQEKG